LPLPFLFTEFTGAAFPDVEQRTLWQRGMLKVVRRIASICAGMLVALALAQAGSSAPRRRVRSRADAGPMLLGTDPPGRLRPAPPIDGGVAQQDAGPDEVHRELQTLRGRVDALERERALALGQSQQLEQVVRELRELRSQLSAAEAQKQAQQEQKAARYAQVQDTINTLYLAQQRLASGDYEIGAALDQAQAAFSGQAQRDIAAARQALQNRDLAAARAYLVAAISDAQRDY